ncbi:MAG: ABC transporter permease [Deltaproteobacteria bacterium]|nr:ABC transporter permease [Deltaproteobacteria bacterium]
MAAVGRMFLSVSDTVGGITLTLARILRAASRLRFDRDETWLNLYKVGVKSYPIVIMTAIFTGAIMVIQSGQYVKQTGATGLLGWGAGYAVLAEVGPVLIGLMFSGRVGANNTAELGTMKVTEQIDALRALAIDPMQHLVVPRFLAMVVMLLLLTALGDLFALVGGALTSQFILDVDWRVFFNGVFNSQLLDEYLVGLTKGVTFGASISVVSCFYGLGVSGGAAGVGRAVNNCVVTSAIGIFVWDYIITYLAN